MDPKRRERISQWLAHRETLPAHEQAAFLAQCRQRDPVAAQLLQELLAYANNHKRPESD